VWCAILVIIGPQFFADDAQHVVTVSAEKHKVLLEKSLANEQHHDDHPAWFQEDRVTATLHELPQ
jgi:hypothetical protein